MHPISILELTKIEAVGGVDDVTLASLVNEPIGDCCNSGEEVVVV